MPATVGDVLAAIGLLEIQLSHICIAIFVIVAIYFAAEKIKNASEQFSFEASEKVKK